MALSIIGGVGNKLFFVISGFLVWYSIQPIKNDLRGILGFYIKRAVRIIPLYWIVVAGVWLLIPGYFSAHVFSSDGSLVLNLIFFRGYGHLWFVQHLLLMYLTAPWIILLLDKLFGYIKDKAATNALKGVALIVLAMLEKAFLTGEVFHMAGTDGHEQFQIWIFLFGMSAAYFCEAFKERECGRLLSEKRCMNRMATIYIAVMMVWLFLMTWVPVRNHMGGIAVVFDNEVLRTILAAVACFLIAFSDDERPLNLLENKLFGLLADISYGMYLVHLFLLRFFRTGSGFRDFLANFVISMCIAFFITMIIDKPIARAVRKKLSV